MKQFDLKCVRKRSFIAFAVVIFLTSLVITAFTFVRLMKLYGEMGALSPILAAIAVIIIGKQLFSSKCRIDITEQEIIYYKKNVIQSRAYLRELTMIRHKVNAANDFLTIYQQRATQPLIHIETDGEHDQINELLVALFATTPFIPHQSGNGWTEYLHRDNTKQDSGIVEHVQQRKVNKKRALIFAAIAGGFIFFVLPFIFLAVNKPRVGMQIGDDHVSYDGKPLDVNFAQVTWLSSSIVKDSTRVYFRDQILDWADAPTFEKIGSVLYKDKNGVYREQMNLLTKNKMIPLEGDYDAETLTEVCSSFFKDKNQVYSFQAFELIDKKHPLTPIKIEGIDPATFETVAPQLWYGDANHIYFGDWASLRICPEIDRETFEIVSSIVFKDKNNVYYLTRNLSSDDQKATERDNYAILTDADARTFRMIDQTTYADKDNEWTISK